MKPYTISFLNRHRQIFWLRIFAGILAAVYGGMFWFGFRGDGSTFNLTVHFISFIFWLSVSTTWFLNKLFPYPIITLNNTGITYGKKNRITNVVWSEIEEIRISTNTLDIKKATGEPVHLNVEYLKYRDLQEIKNRLQKFTAARGVQYTSKY